MSETISMHPDYQSIKKWLESVIDDPGARKRVLIRATLELKDRAAAYPPAGPWNREPGTRGNGIWYQRQFGPRWRMENGALGGLNTSERLQKSWKTEISQDAYDASVFTPVTYAPKLMDEAQREPWAAKHGWQTVDEIALDYAPRFVDLVEETIDEQARKPIE
jgi:pilus assembly protein Flp/PilA